MTNEVIKSGDCGDAVSEGEGEKASVSEGAVRGAGNGDSEIDENATGSASNAEMKMGTVETGKRGDGEGISDTRKVLGKREGESAGSGICIGNRGFLSAAEKGGEIELRTVATTANHDEIYNVARKKTRGIAMNASWDAWMDAWMDASLEWGASSTRHWMHYWNGGEHHASSGSGDCVSLLKRHRRRAHTS